MDMKSLITRLSERTGRPEAEIETRLRTVGQLVAELVGQGDSVSLPGFGTFEPRMRDERVAVHPLTGKRMLVPPKLSLAFKPSALLRQKVRNAVAPEEDKADTD